VSGPHHNTHTPQSVPHTDAVSTLDRLFAVQSQLQALHPAQDGSNVTGLEAVPVAATFVATILPGHTGQVAYNVALSIVSREVSAFQTGNRALLSPEIMADLTNENQTAIPGATPLPADPLGSLGFRS
jgi:hypothetical protein